MDKLNFSFAILAGGESKRMGADKGLVLFAGKPLVEWIILQLEFYKVEKLIISNSPDKYKKFGLPVYGDIQPGIGALGGLYSALEYASQELVIVLACDMPIIRQPLIELLLTRSPGFDVVIPNIPSDTCKNRYEPFRALYRKQTCLPPIIAAIQNGKRRMISFFEQVKVFDLHWKDIQSVDPEKISFANINSPEDLSSADTKLTRYLPIE